MEPRMPGPFQKFQGGQHGKFRITGDFPSISSEQRRQLLQEFITKQLTESGWPDITVTKLGYQVMPEIGASQSLTQYSCVRIALAVPAFVDANSKVVLKMNVPPSGDWSLEIIRRVLLFTAAWIEKLPPRP